MIEVTTHPALTPWKPTPTNLPQAWLSLAETMAQQARGSQHTYVLKVKYDAQRVGKMLQCWGLPWQVVIAGYLWEYDEEQILSTHLPDADQVLSHIAEANLYARFIENENLPDLLAPPYRDLGALLVAVAIYYQALQTLQEQSNEQPYTGAMQSQIENVGRTLLNIGTRLGMWYFKRDVEDLTEQLRSPRKFAEAKQEHASILKQDAIMLEDVRQLLMASYQDATQQHISISCSVCGIAGMRRRLQDANTTATSQKTQLTGFDLVTFDLTVPTVQQCYTAFGALSQLGYIQDRVTDLIANPKANGCSHIAFGLNLKPQGPYTQGLKWPESYTRICQLLIATPLMHAINWYGCIHPHCYQLYTKTPRKEEVAPPHATRLWDSEGGKVFFTIKEDLTRGQLDTKTPIVVYDDKHTPIALPKGATALDFAFAVSSELGEHAVDALINNRKAPLYRTLDAGDLVEIRTSVEIQAQDYWLHENYTKTSLARRSIRDSLSRRSLDRRGYNLLNQALERYHFMLTPEDLDQEIGLLVERHNLGSLQAYLERLDKTAELSYTPDWAAKEIMQQIEERANSLSMLRSRSNWVPILDMQLTASRKLFHQQRLCGFCQPTYPRDMKIMGRLRKRSGELVVHKASCPHLIDRSKGHRSVLLSMIWQLQPPAFRVAFFIIAQDRKGLILDLTRQLRRHQCDLVSMNAEAVSKFGEARIRFIIETYEDKGALDIWQDLYSIENVTKAEIDAASTSVHTRERLQNLREQRGFLTDKALSVESTWEEALAILPPRNLMLKNPFDISRPAMAKMFFGRSEETKMMQRELCEDEYGKALLLYGPRRSGKSSICKNFLERQVQPPFWSVLFSLQNAMEHNEETILIQLADEVCRKFHEQLRVPAPHWQHFHDSDPQVRFKRIVQNCIDQVPGARLVLALDEFGGVLEAYERQILEQRFFTFWKDLMHEVPQVSLILAMPTASHSTLNLKQFANAFSFAQTLPVLFLDAESAKQLLVDPLQDQHIAIHPNTIALAVKLTGGNPYYMTLIGQQLIQQLNHDPDKQVVTDKDLRLVVEQFIQSGSNQNFVYIKRELQGEDELRILEAIVEFTSRTSQLEVQLKKIAHRLNLPFSVVRRHLDRLCNGLILQENGPPSNPSYSFTIELVRRWLARNRWFFSSSA